MKLIPLLLATSALALLPSCAELDASAGSTERPPENGAQFRKGEGLSLTEEMARSIGLQTGGVTEQKVAARIPLTLRPLEGGQEAAGWLPADPAGKIRTGAVVELSGTPRSKGTIKSIQKPAFGSLGDYEVTVTMDVALKSGGELAVSVLLPETDSVTTVPLSALLKTAEGHFVYAANGTFYVRTPVKVGAMDADHVEIIEGLYAGDEVVTVGVTPLWMAELQVLRGGKACTCGQ